MFLNFNPRVFFTALMLLVLVLAPVYASVYSEPFYLTLFGRIVIFAIAASSLNLILGYGGLVSFGHALYFGLGSYVVGIAANHGIESGWIQLIIVLSACAVIGGLTGVVSLRTNGIAFIMITLAFSQMFFFLFVSLKQYGGDDGLPLVARSNFGLMDLTNNVILYYLALAVLFVVLWLGHHMIHSRFGMVLRGSKSNERRMKALGFPTLRYKLTAYVISTMICGVAGMLFGNLSNFASPSYLSWATSGDLIVMVMLGGVATLMGPVWGAFAFLLIEEVFKSLSDHSMLYTGALIVVIVLVSKRGLYGALIRWEEGRTVSRLYRNIKAEPSVENGGISKKTPPLGEVS
jgi:branched-chain amino acid transport system permease protein